MKRTTIGVFVRRDEAEKFINAIHNDLSIPHDDISYIYKNTEGEIKEVETSNVSSVNTKEGAKKGAGAGAVVGALGGLAAVAGIIPVVGPLLIAGPLVTALGITGGVGVTAAGAASGAAIGGLAGALVGYGTGKEKAQQYEDLVAAGNILVAVHSENDILVREALAKYGAIEAETYEVRV